MGRGTTEVRALAIVLSLVFAVGSTGCQKLYGGKSEKLKTPDKKKRPPEPPETEIVIKYVEDCVADFRGDPAKVRPQPAMANQLVGEGETALQSSEKAKDPNSQAELIRVSIDKFRNALLKDPYNHEATLQLALAYDKVLRKGCALAMLRRLETLAANPTFQPDAEPMIELVASNPHWFKPYHPEALKAVGL